MSENYLAYIFFIYAIIAHSIGAEYMDRKPEYIKTCQRKFPDPEFVACSTKSIQILFKQFAIGIDGLDLKIDPIALKRIKILSSEGPVSLNTTLSKPVVTGLANTQVVRSYVNPTDYSWEAIIRVPKLRIDGNYDMKGRILVVPLVGRGKLWIEPNKMEIMVYTKPKLYEKFGHIFYNVTEVQVNFTMEGLQLHLGNLFNGIKLLEESTNAYLNENWKDVSEAFIPIIKKTIEDILLEILNTIFNYMPADYLVSDIPHPSVLYGKS